MKKILVTGSSGFVGRNLVSEIEKDPGYKVYKMARKAPGSPGEIVLDFCDDNFCSRVSDLPKVDVIVHLGAKVGWDDRSKPDFLSSNILATACLARWAEKIGAHFIFASTIAVCGSKNTRIGPDSSPDPDNDYGKSKWIAEEAIKMSGAKYCILRISGIFGENGPRHMVLNRAIDEAISGKLPVLYGKGEQKRNYIYVRDLVKDIIYCIDNGIQGTHFISGSYSNSISEILKDLCDVFLPGKSPVLSPGNDGMDQIVERSIQFPKTRNLKDAMQDIRRGSDENRHSG